jgi:hypothetical protein
MKKIISFLIIACSLFAVNYSQAQDAATTKGDVLLDLGVGFVGGDYHGYVPGTYGTVSTWNYNNANNRVQIPTLSMSLQKAFWNDITIGGQFAFNVFGSEHDLQQSDGYYQHSKYVQSNMYFLGRGEYHFGRLAHWPRQYDLYAGALLGMRVSNSSETQIYEGWGNGQPGTWRNDYPNRTRTDIGPDAGIFGGVRLYFAGNMGVFAEGGFGITVLRAGLIWRL